MLVGDLMDRDLTAVSPETTVAEAVEIMAGHRISGVPVVDEEGRVQGFLSEKDVIRAALPGYFDLLQDSSFLPDYGQFRKRLQRVSLERVDKYMKGDVIVFEEQDTDLHAAMVLISRNLKRAPVVRDGVFSGVISRADLLDYILHSREEPSD
ncbi:MAG TPA: histidine kinase [Synergistaceae bacterium]|jgi:CBS domain-containing protein|nr:histidine kinase [Synergistaceae bacterium]